jgi:putative nucleotidyltransferase with HDIG domain
MDAERIYLVGGAIRDAVLGQSSHDLDFVVAGDSLTTARKMADALGGAFFTLDEEFQVGRVVLAPEDASRQEFDFVKLQGDTLIEDLRKRDFTVNAMAISLGDLDELIDPLGGLEDLIHHRLKPCSQQSLISDPVRTLRAVRMSAKYQLVIPPETRKLIVEAVPKLGKVSVERLRDEFLKLLEAPKPAASLRVLDRFGALEILIPEIADMKGVDQSPPHIHELWEHTLHTVQALERILHLLDTHYSHDNEMGGDLFSGLLSQRLGRYRKQISDHLAEQLVPERSVRGLIFLSALLHDIGKPLHRTVEESGRIRFIGHEETGAETAAKIGTKMKLGNREIRRLKRTVADHTRPWHLASAKEMPSKKVVYRFWSDNADAGIDICLLELADLKGVYGHTLTKDLMERHLDTIRYLLESYFESPAVISPQALLDGHDLISKFGIKPGPLVGELLKELIEAQVEGELETKEQANTFVSDYLSKLKEA